jgi:hypothetical protein
VIPKALKHRFGIRARRVAVRPHVPWYLRWLALTVTGTGAVVLLWFAYHYGQVFAGFDRQDIESTLKKLTSDNAQLEKANTSLKSELAVVDRQLQIERATYGDLAKQVKALTNENARLKEDVALMQAISAPDAKIEGVKLSSLRVEPNPVAGEYSYRIVLLQTGSRSKPFQGSYQLVVNLQQDGKRMGMTVPAAGERSAAGYQLDFRVHQRIDGTFKVSPDAVVHSVQVRVFEGGQSQPKVMQTVTLS